MGMSDGCMAEAFDTNVKFTGKVARKFREYDSDPWKYETPESQEIAKRARLIAESMCS